MHDRLRDESDLAEDETSTSTEEGDNELMIEEIQLIRDVTAEYQLPWHVISGIIGFIRRQMAQSKGGETGDGRYCISTSGISTSVW